MGRKSNYADLELPEKISDTLEYTLHLANGARRFDPSNGTATSEEGPKLSLLTERSSGDWSWKPHRDKVLGDRMITYKPPRHPLQGIRF